MEKTMKVIAGLPLLAPVVLCASLALAQTESVAPGKHLIHPINQVFTLRLFIMLGPIKIIGPFVKVTGPADDSLRRSIALRAFWISTMALVLAATAGQFLLGKWHLSIVSLQIAGSIILFLVALQMVMAHYEGTPASRCLSPFPMPPKSGIARHSFAEALLSSPRSSSASMPTIDFPLVPIGGLP